ncbi:hypothetical protein BHE74_00011637 [Ensete ventricosum]|nr:hypothetical protein BHE74_00011637 [Ensete ventricosum]
MPPAEADGLLDDPLETDEHRFGPVVARDHHLSVAREHRKLLLAALPTALLESTTHPAIDGCQHPSLPRYSTEPNSPPKKIWPKLAESGQTNQFHSKSGIVEEGSNNKKKGEISVIWEFLEIKGRPEYSTFSNLVVSGRSSLLILLMLCVPTPLREPIAVLQRGVLWEGGRRRAYDDVRNGGRKRGVCGISRGPRGGPPAPHPSRYPSLSPQLKALSDTAHLPPPTHEEISTRGRGGGHDSCSCGFPAKGAQS